MSLTKMDNTVQCGDKISCDGQPFGIIHCWAKADGVSGASVGVEPALRPLANICGMVLRATHVFLPEDLPERFTVIGTRGKR